VVLSSLWGLHRFEASFRLQNHNKEAATKAARLQKQKDRQQSTWCLPPSMDYSTAPRLSTKGFAIMRNRDASGSSLQKTQACNMIIYNINKRAWYLPPSMGHSTAPRLLGGLAFVTYALGPCMRNSRNHAITSNNECGGVVP